MNKVCSAGTGSFLEEMATLLGLDIVGAFGEEALRSRAPIELGDRCTVFMGSEIARRLQEGCAREDLAAGLAYAVVRNYLGRVVGRHPRGTHSIFQGGVAGNAAVLAALRNVLGRDVTVHPFNEAAGAIGVALLAARHVKGPSRFRSAGGLDLSRVRTRSFSCSRCSNRCTVHITRGRSGRRFFAGGLCDRYEGRGDGKRSAARPDLFAERDEAAARWMPRWGAMAWLVSRERSSSTSNSRSGPRSSASSASPMCSRLRPPVRRSSGVPRSRGAVPVFRSRVRMAT
jgi:hypothetical protein